MLSKGEVYFCLHGTDLDPEAVTNIIGLEPTSITRVDPPRPTKSTWRFSSGKIEAEVIDVYALATSVIRRLEPYRENICEAKARFGLQAWLVVVLWISTEEGDSTPAIGFDNQVIRFLSEVGASIDVDTYLLSQ